MEKKSTVVAIIPARGSSKGIPHKNIRDLAGKPLIAYTIEAALKSEKITKIIVSTDDEKIAAVAKCYGAEVPFLRPSDLAKDCTPTLPVIKHAISFLENSEGLIVDIVVILQPTSPLRKTEHINESIEKLVRTKCDSVVTVCPVKHHPCWSWRINNDKLIPFNEEGIKISRRQNLPAVYTINGAVYAVKKNVLVCKNTIFGKDTRAVIMPPEDSIDIDDYFDFFMAEMIIKYWKK